MKKNILIIGASGSVSLEVIKLLSKQDVNIRIGVRNPDKARTMHLPQVEIMRFDYCDPSTYDEVFYGIDNWLLVSLPAHFKFQDCVNEVVDHAKQAGVKHVVNVSKMGIQDDNHPMRVIEDHIENTDMDYTFLRPNCYMQYFNTYFREGILEENIIQLPAGKARTSFVDIRDVAEAAIKLLTDDHQENKTYQLTGKEAHNIDEIASLLSEELEREIQYAEVSEDDFRSFLEFDGWSEAVIDHSISLCRFVKQGWNAVITSGIYDILNREPRSFKEYIHDYAEYWKEPVAH